MAVFTAIGAAVASAIGLTGTFATIAGVGLSFAGTVVSGLVAAGLAIGTSRALGLTPDIPSMNTQDPGTSVQLPPATFNKLPVIYGKIFTSGPIFDAAISNQNKTMTYCIALSEETQTGNFTVSNIFMNDVRLIFSGNTVTSHVDPNQTSATSYNGNVRVNVYQGGSAGGDVIFPTSGTGNTTPATSIVPHWGVNHTANAMVYAVIQIDYDAENGLTGLPTMTFEMENSLKNPGDVLYDYLTSDRYGAGLTNADIDVNSITGTANTSMKGYCDELVSYQDQSNVTQTNARYEINGILSTFDNCKTNIDKICQASATFFTYKVPTGQFAAVPNRAISSAEEANCLVYNDDNIVSRIDISSTELYSLYNAVEIEFADKNRKDQVNTIKLETPAGDRNPNEPDNVLKYKIQMINDNIRAERLANIDLNSSRVSTVIQFEADWYGIQSEVGDIIKVTNSLYGWTDKLFRVMRVAEKTSETGMITAQLTCMEYSADYYTNPVSNETQDAGLIDLPRIPVIREIPIIEAYNGNYGNLAALPNVYGNVIVNQAMKTFGAGVQVEDANLSNTTIANSTTFAEIIPRATYDITDADIGDYSYDAFATPGGVIPASYDLGFTSNGIMTFANTTATANVGIGGGGQTFTNFNTPATTVTSQTKFSTDATTYALPSDMKATQLELWLEGYSSMDTSNVAPRSFGNMKYQVVRVTKGEK